MPKVVLESREAKLQRQRDQLADAAIGALGAILDARDELDVWVW